VFINLRAVYAPTPQRLSLKASSENPRVVRVENVYPIANGTNSWLKVEIMKRRTNIENLTLEPRVDSQEPRSKPFKGDDVLIDELFVIVARFVGLI
jgi:hypothetical protein